MAVVVSNQEEAFGQLFQASIRSKLPLLKQKAALACLLYTKRNLIAKQRLLQNVKKAWYYPCYQIYCLPVRCFFDIETICP